MRRALGIMSVCSFLMVIASIGFVALNTFASIVPSDSVFIETPLSFLVVFLFSYTAFIISRPND